MDKVNITPDNMDVLHQGMYAVVHGAGGLTTGKPMSAATVSISGKTGTSESTKILGDGSQVIVTANNAVALLRQTIQRLRLELCCQIILKVMLLVVRRQTKALSLELPIYTTQTKLFEQIKIKKPS